MNFSDNTQRVAIKEEDNLPDIDYHNIKKADAVLKAINHKLRLLLLKTIQERRYTVSEIYIKLQMEQSIVSQHLALLRRAGIVTADRNGKYIFYSINPSRIEEINEFAKNLVGN